MKKIYIILFSMVFSSIVSIAGNKDRSGQAGAGDLLINPWARSAGWGGVNTSNGKGIDALHTNPAGLNMMDTTELVFSYTNWLGGAGLSNMAVGFAQRIKDVNILSLSFVNMSSSNEMFATTEETPDGNGGIIKPSLTYINLSYGRQFSNRIFTGLNIKLISTSIDDISASGVGIDVGIQYLTGANENLHFGIAVKNLGTEMSFNGAGTNYRAFVFGQGEYSLTMQQRSAKFELPTCLNLGAAYDFLFLDEEEKPSNSRLTVAANFTSNAFSKDQIIAGVEYGFKNIFMVRAGFVYEDGVFNSTDRTTASTGLHAGVTLQTRIGKKENNRLISLDYAFRTTKPFNGVHSIGARLSL